MHLDQFQQEAMATDQRPGTSVEALVIPLLGLVGETGTLLTQFKKFLRDGPGHELFTKQVAEELGDVLWYVANLATKFGLSLDQVAAANIEKVRGRWLATSDHDAGPVLFDDQFPRAEQLPRHFEVFFTLQTVRDRPGVLVTRDGVAVGDPLTDNAYIDDGYRFHDIFHFAFAVVLGWSPVTRRNLGCKRKCDPVTDEVEDGGRAIVTEEAIAAFMYDYARNHGFFAAVQTIDYDRLKTIQRLTAALEVGVRSARDWERAILEGYRIWRQLREHNGGIVTCNLIERTLDYRTAQAAPSANNLA
jgi:NTP pyrophosphatase (non-canonical NTP hydrolase)